MTPPAKKFSVPFTLFMVLFTIFSVPLLIATPFLLFGFIGRP